MRTLVLLLALSLAAGAPLCAQSAKTRPDSAHIRLLSKTQGRHIVRSISAADFDASAEEDCSHLVHALYEKAGFPYDYASSHDLYTGHESFVRVSKPQPGDLVVWRGHVGIVTDPRHHVFFSSLSDGPGTQAYNSAYWRSRGAPRFYRYVIGKPDATATAAAHPNN